MSQGKKNPTGSGKNDTRLVVDGRVRMRHPWYKHGRKLVPIDYTQNYVHFDVGSKLYQIRSLKDDSLVSEHEYL